MMRGPGVWGLASRVALPALVSLAFSLLAAFVLVAVWPSLGTSSPGQGDEAELLQAQDKDGWQQLAVWGDPVDGEKKETIDASEPDWLKHYKSEKGGFSHAEAQLEEAKKLRDQLEVADKTFHDAVKVLNRADGEEKAPAFSDFESKGFGPPSPKRSRGPGPKLQLSPEFVRNGEVVTMEWWGIDQVSAEDFIAVYSPPHADNHDYLELHNVTDCETWKEGRGKLYTKLYNIRQQDGFQVRYFRKGLIPNQRGLFLGSDEALGSMLFCPKHHCREEVFFLVSESNKATFPPYEATQVRLSMTGVPTEMRVMWVSEKCPPKPFGGPVVIFDTKSCDCHDHCRYKQHAIPLYRTYSASDMCGAPANIEGGQHFLDPGIIYDALMQDLIPGQRYFYRVGCQDAPHAWRNFMLSKEGWPVGSMMSDEMSFVATPWVKPSQKASFIAYADSGVTTTHGGHEEVTEHAPEHVNKGILKQVLQGEVGMVMHMGGLSYARGRAYTWEQWGKLTEPISMKVPYMVTVGNDEYDHLPTVGFSLTQPPAANGVEYELMEAHFAPKLDSFKRVFRATIVEVSGEWAFLCNFPRAEEAGDIRAKIEKKFVLVSAEGCRADTKARNAELLGAEGVIVESVKGQELLDLQKSTLGFSHKYKIGIPTILIDREDGEDLRVWLNDHDKVEASMASSLHLQRNDPSLSAQELQEDPAGFHPSWGDFGDDSNGECGVPFAQRFHMPSSGNGNFWYTFDYGSIKVVVVSTEHDFRKGSRQYRWLRKTLRNTDRKATPWLVVSMHRSIYGRDYKDSRQKVMNHLQHHLEPMFYHYRVDLVLSGHEHRYLRTAPVYMDLNKQTQGKQAPTYAVVGTGGAQLQYRARDGVHHHFYCVGGANPMARCGPCNSYACYDNDKCCDYHLDDKGFGEYSQCGFCEHINATGPGPYMKKSSPAGPRDPQTSPPVTPLPSVLSHNLYSSGAPKIEYLNWSNGILNLGHSTVMNIRWGWVRAMHSSFGFLKVTALSSKHLKVEWVRSWHVFHDKVVDKNGRNIHPPRHKGEVGCQENCDAHGLPDGDVVDSVTLTRHDDE